VRQITATVETGMAATEPVPDLADLMAPAPAKDCDVCEALARQRIEAQALGEYSKLSDCNVEIRKHPHPGR
jgi:hypothetical protein